MEVNFVSCLSWVKSGVAKTTPDVIAVNTEDLKKMIDEAKIRQNGSSSNQNAVSQPMETGESDDDFERRYNLNNYDDEDEDSENAEPDLGLAGLAVHSSNVDDPYLDPAFADEDEDEERENLQVNDTDNLLLVGHVEGDAALLEVYLHNDTDFYPHHDIILPAYPLSLQTLSLMPDYANCVAASDFTPDINIWNLDVINLLEPVAKLTGDHTDSVLTLGWDKDKCLASGGADHRVVLWDVIQKKSTRKFKKFNEKVQSVSFRPDYSESLLIGDCSGTVSLADCRSSGKPKNWMLPDSPEVECVAWDETRTDCFFAAADSGLVYCFDQRMKEVVYCISAHSDAVTTVCQSQNRNCLVTASADKSFKVWNIGSGTSASFVVEHPKLNVGRILAVAPHPEKAYVFAVGGDAPSDNHRVIDISSLSAVRQSFGIGT